jgi:hypothetical protein
LTATGKLSIARDTPCAEVCLCPQCWQCSLGTSSFAPAFDPAVRTGATTVGESFPAATTEACTHWPIVHGANLRAWLLAALQFHKVLRIYSRSGAAPQQQSPDQQQRQAHFHSKPPTSGYFIPASKSRHGMCSSAGKASCRQLPIIPDRRGAVNQNHRFVRRNITTARRLFPAIRFPLPGAQLYTHPHDINSSSEGTCISNTPESGLAAATSRPYHGASS